MSESLSLWGLFFSAFLSSTILPGSSEVVLGALAIQGHHSTWSLLAVATIGNTLGGMSSWGLGRLLEWRFPMADLAHPAHRRAVQRMRQWGSPALLLSWVPFIGDPLCVAGGWLRIPWPVSFVYIGIGKGLRYAALLGVLTITVR
ncbi:MAG: DedA family protein [Nitrospira sp.]|nr:DedA family protein [Nitrospira sp.]MCA9474985.1 DedA family protein [Nitrospira sp.]MDR4487817.1 DedA family protein [Nitrospirales bacterium]HQU27884.1 YqaA family protein [Nitrospirales bacterium]